MEVYTFYMILNISYICTKQLGFGLLCYFILFADYNVVRSDDVPIGYSVQLNCLSTYEHLADYFIVQWEKQSSQSSVFLWRKGQLPREGQGYEGRVEFLDNAALIISDVRLTDEGLYDCKKWDVTGVLIGNISTSYLGVFDDIPKWTEQPKNVISAPDSHAEFNCATQPPADSIEWRRNGKTLTNTNSVVTISKNKLLIRAGTTFIEQQQQVGVYHCLAKWKNAALQSVSATLTIATMSPFQQNDRVNVSTQVGGNAVLQGFMPFSIPSAVPSVTHNNKSVMNHKDKILLLPSGNLHFQNVSFSDEGFYWFSAFNTITQETMTAKYPVVLNVHNAEMGFSPQLLAAQQERNTLPVGSSVTLECAANGNPPPNITWSKYGGILPVGRYRQVLGNLLLFDLRTNDTGTYICGATNGVGYQVSAISTLDVIDEAKIVNWVAEYSVRDGEELVLDCHTASNVSTWWLFNATNVTFENVIFKGNKLIFSSSQRRHAGFYQCFAANKFGVVMLITRVRVLPRVVSSEDSLHNGPRREPPIHLVHGSSWNQSKNYSSSDMDPPDFSERDWQDPKTLNKRRNRKKNKQKSGSNGDVVMIPPTRPEVTKLSDESVMVRWDVPPNSGLQIQFFKVQYRDSAKKPASRWMTIDEDIPPHILSYEVPSLRTGHTYRFRIAAVYSNNDNKLGPTSHRFTLQKDPPMKKPVVGPEITETKTISQSAIAINWKYEDIEEMPIDGFFIYYRATTSAGTYTKVTVLGANTPSHIISHLLPDTSYDIKMQCFNSAGTSEFSNIHTQKTFAFSSDEEKENEVNVEPQPVPNTAANNQLLYIILGTVMGTLVILLLLFIGYCTCKQKRRSTGALNLNHGKSNGDAQEYTASNTTEIVANGNSGLSTSIFLWQKKTSHIRNDNVESSIEIPQILEKNQVESSCDDCQSGSHDSIDETSFNQ